VINGRDARGRILKGTVANPQGRPREYRSFRQQAQAFMDREGIGILLDMARARDGFAVKLLAEYAYGKPQQHVDLTTGGQPLIKAYIDLELDRACP
jgi:hypothetical protein